MIKSTAQFGRARELADSGRHAEVLEFFDGWSGAKIGESAQASLLYGTAFARLGHHEKGQQWIERALDRARALGEHSVETRALNARGGVAFVTGRIELIAKRSPRACMLRIEVNSLLQGLYRLSTPPGSAETKPQFMQ